MVQRVSLWSARFSTSCELICNDINLQVGHSLGGALAELDCMFMALNLPPNVPIKGVTYGTPRVGNAAWATLFDATVSAFNNLNP